MSADAQTIPSSTYEVINIGELVDVEEYEQWLDFPEAVTLLITVCAHDSGYLKKFFDTPRLTLSWLSKFSETEKQVFIQLIVNLVIETNDEELSQYLSSTYRFRVLVKGISIGGRQLLNCLKDNRLDYIKVNKKWDTLAIGYLFSNARSSVVYLRSILSCRSFLKRSITSDEPDDSQVELNVKRIVNLGIATEDPLVMHYLRSNYSRQFDEKCSITLRETVQYHREVMLLESSIRGALGQTEQLLNNQGKLIARLSQLPFLTQLQGAKLLSCLKRGEATLLLIQWNDQHHKLAKMLLAVIISRMKVYEANDRLSDSMLDKFKCELAKYRTIFFINISSHKDGARKPENFSLDRFMAFCLIGLDKKEYGQTLERLGALYERCEQQSLQETKLLESFADSKLLEGYIQDEQFFESLFSSKYSTFSRSRTAKLISAATDAFRKLMEVSVDVACPILIKEDNVERLTSLLSDGLVTPEKTINEELINTAIFYIKRDAKRASLKSASDTDIPEKVEGSRAISGLASRSYSS